MAGKNEVCYYLPTSTLNMKQCYFLKVFISSSELDLEHYEQIGARNDSNKMRKWEKKA